MSQNHNALFVTNPTTFKSEVTGGVQMCSQEFYDLIKACGFDITVFYIDFTRSILHRICIRMKFNLYYFFDIKNEGKKLIQHIETANVEWVFFNMSSMLRFSKPIKNYFGNKVNIVLLSHGNDSGDFLHLTTKPLGTYSAFAKLRDIIRLGFLLHIESYYRVNYIDSVFVVSETEKQIENWMGAKQVFFIPRLIKNEQLTLQTNYNRVGFVGRLDHPPNFQGISLVLEELSKTTTSTLEVRLVGAPHEWGEKIKKKYSFVTYLGELSNLELEHEASTWSIFINPVFWYSTGVTTKLAKAIGWGVPVLTTTAGMRGYKWEKGSLLIAETPKQMADKIINVIGNKSLISQLIDDVKVVRESSSTIDELAKELKNMLEQV